MSETRELLNQRSELHTTIAEHFWGVAARTDQLPPEAISEKQNWLVWLLLGGRGAGKTRAGAEWVRAMAQGRKVAGGVRARRIALVGPTYAEARAIMVEGVSGLLSIHLSGERPRYDASLRRLLWPSGTIAQLFSAEDPEALRGPQFDAAWCDELCRWAYPEQTWDMLQFALRLGVNPRQVITTTPRPIPLLKKLMSAESTVTSRSRTNDNEDNLSSAFLRSISERYAGTRLGRQELEAELIEDNPDALWQRNELEVARIQVLPELMRVVVAVDPPATSGDNANACGILAAGLTQEGNAVVLEDATLDQARPLVWARHAVSLYHKLKADRLVAEANQGGEMVEALIRQADPTVAVKMVRATRGKALRAEPVAALYERGKVKHLGTMVKLEDEMCHFTRSLGRAQNSPDRLDALVWGLTELMLSGEAGEPRVQVL
ncbi:MAG: DNA-packaging protein [Hyphomicrobiales bacterium]